MKITILNGNPTEGNELFENYLINLSSLAESRGHDVVTLLLRDMDIRYCIGCFGCWVKTPGKCSNSDDDMHTVCSHYINSDLVIFASPVIMGFTSALLKRVHDRIIPLVMPYVRFYDGESHHLPRYEKYPTMSLLLAKETDTDNGDLEIISEIYKRDSLNFHAPFVFLGTTDKPVEEVADAIDRI